MFLGNKNGPAKGLVCWILEKLFFACGLQPKVLHFCVKSTEWAGNFVGRLTGSLCEDAIWKCKFCFITKESRTIMCVLHERMWCCSMMILILASEISQVTISSLYFLTQNFGLETQDLILKARFCSQKLILRIKSQVLRIKMGVTVNFSF